MFRPRVIPVLLLKDKGLVKTEKFKKPTYIGDPINAVKIFNDLKADELVFVDINASKQNRTVSAEFVKRISEEAFMPFAVGGGINKIEHVKELINSGAEKVVINTALSKNPQFIQQAVSQFGSQSVVGSIDVKKNFFGIYKALIKDGSKQLKQPLEEYVTHVEGLGVGEIMINSIDCDGMMQGYDWELISLVSELVDVPVIACGGAGSLNDMVKVVYQHGAHAAAAGSMFVYHSKMKGVLINYPTQKKLKNTFDNA